MTGAPTVRIQTFADGSFELFDQGQPAHVLDVRDWRGQAFDAVAWLPGDENRWWLECRVATVLGEDALQEVDWHEGAILLVETPAAWLRARFAGECLSCCILDWSCDVRAALAQAPEIRCASEALARRLRRRCYELAAPAFKIVEAGDAERDAA